MLQNGNASNAADRHAVGVAMGSGRQPSQIAAAPDGPETSHEHVTS
jgi:hypothetical protein